MKNKPKNTQVFNYEYLDSLKNFLMKDALDQESKIVFCRKVLQALAATEKGELDEHYRLMKKNPTEHKAIEYIIELLLKKEDSSLASMAIDYSSGIFSVFKTHGLILKESVIQILRRELEVFLAQPQVSMQQLETVDLFDHYRIILDNLLHITRYHIEELEPQLHNACEVAINQICSLCDQLKQAFSNKTITNSKFALRISYMLDLHQDAISDIWGTLRLNLLRLLIRNYTLDLLEKEKKEEVLQKTSSHPTSCDCCKDK